MSKTKDHKYYQRTLAPVRTSEKPDAHARYTKDSGKAGRILVRNSPFIFTCQEDDKLLCLRNHSMIIEGSEIKDVFPAEKRPAGSFDLVYDAGKRGGIVITPGLVNTHTHLPMYLMRSAMMLDANETIDQTIAAMPEWERAMNNEDYVYSTIGDLSEQQKHGITSSLSHFAVYDPIENASKVTKHNVVNAISAASNTHPENNPELIQKLIEKRGKSFSQVAIAVHYLHKAPPATLKKVSLLAKKHDLIFTCHLAESKHVAEECQREHGLREVDVLRKYGLLNDRTIVSHAIYLNSKEIKELAKHKVGIAHLPTSNTIHKSGIFPIWKFLDAGAQKQISLGTDSVVSKSRMDVLTEAYQARLTHLYKKRLKFGTLFKMITINGANILHMQNRGRVLPGYKADLCFWKLRDRGFIPYDHDNPFTLLGNIITHNGRTVRDLMVNGEFIIKDRKHIFIDESRLLDKLQARHMEMRKRLGK